MDHRPMTKITPGMHANKKELNASSSVLETCAWVETLPIANNLRVVASFKKFQITGNMLLKTADLDQFLKDCEITSVGVRHLIKKTVASILDADNEDDEGNPSPARISHTPNRSARTSKSDLGSSVVTISVDENGEQIKKRGSTAAVEGGLQTLGEEISGGLSEFVVSPSRTREWVTIREGFLIKTKQLGIGSSVKLRWFVLKQEPAAGGTGTETSRSIVRGEQQGVMEYYEGRTIRGSIHLVRSAAAIIRNRWLGSFSLVTPSRTFELRTENPNMCDVLQDWVKAISDVIATCPLVASQDPSF